MTRGVKQMASHLHQSAPDQSAPAWLIPASAVSGPTTLVAAPAALPEPRLHGRPTPAVLQTLQRTYGNRATRRLLQASRHIGLTDARLASGAAIQTAIQQDPLASPVSDKRARLPAQVSAGLAIQAKLMIGPPQDRYEQEAERVASRVVQQIRSSTPVSSIPGATIQPQAESTPPPVARPDISRLQSSSASPVPLTVLSAPIDLQARSTAASGETVEGGAASNELEIAVGSALGSGRPLDAGLRVAMGRTMGADFSEVRIHTDAQADGLNRRIQARAFTTGRDLFFRRGAYEPGSRAGQQLIAHELTHVVQQGGGTIGQSLPANETVASPPGSSGAPMTGLVQRDIGFEFETRSVSTRRSNTGALPAPGFPNPVAANAVWFAPTSTPVKKGATLLKRPDAEVQADDVTGGSDLEIVTTHFPLNPGGRIRLDNLMADVAILANAFTALVIPTGGIVPATALDGTGGFITRMKDGMFWGNLATATTAPQITFGTRLENIGDIVRDLHGDPHETPLEKATRDPGRLRLRRPDPINITEPKALTALDEASTLIDGHALARAAITAYQLIDNTAPGGAELEGLLTIVFSYAQSMQSKMGFLKSHTPLMAKTDLANLFATLPGPVKNYYSQKDHTGKSKLESLVETSPGYPLKMNQPLFAGVYNVVENTTNVASPALAWYHSLTLESWLRGIVLRDRKRGEAVWQFFHDKYGGSTKRPGIDQLTNKAFPNRPSTQEIEGYGVLGSRMDRDTTQPATRLPIYELRSATLPITYAQARQWALDLFDYIESLNANPGGGYQHIV